MGLPTIHWHIALMLYWRLQINNPDMRVQILKEYVKEHFPATPLLDYAMEVEKITTSKVGDSAHISVVSPLRSLVSPLRSLFHSFLSRVT